MKAKVTVFHNTTDPRDIDQRPGDEQFQGMFCGYSPACDLKVAYRTEVEHESFDPRQTAETVFILDNRNEIPDKVGVRSLSVGDVVQVKYGSEFHFYAVEPIGFRKVDLDDVIDSLS